MGLDSFCMQCQKAVSKEDITTFTAADGRRRRMCSKCKDAAIDRRDAEKRKRTK